jgi:hypothetical protein
VDDIHVSEARLAGVRKNLETFDVAFLASKVAVLGGSLSHNVDQDFLALTGSGMDEGLRIAGVTTQAPKALTLLDAHRGKRRASRCRLKPEHVKREQQGLEKASAAGSGVGCAANGRHADRCA